MKRGRLFHAMRGRLLRIVEGDILLCRRYRQYDIGSRSYGRLTIDDYGAPARVTIGDYCSFARSRIILGGYHRSRWVTTFPFPAFDATITGGPEWAYSKGDVTIGNDVWVGDRVLILAGVTIGDGAVIGAGAVVAGDVPPYAIAVGNPCRVVASRFPEQTVADLLDLAWWDLPEDCLARLMPLLLSADVDAFIAAARREKDSLLAGGWLKH